MWAVEEFLKEIERHSKTTEAMEASYKWEMIRFTFQKFIPASLCRLDWW